jgi:hypothetical protein
VPRVHLASRHHHHREENIVGEFEAVVHAGVTVLCSAMVEGDNEFDPVHAAGKAQASERRIEKDCSGFSYRTRGRRGLMPLEGRKKKNLHPRPKHHG